MTTFTLETSGEVLVQRASSGGPFAYCWSDLNPFTQGYVEALFASVSGELYLYRGADRWPVGFSDLSPEALTAILADCAAYWRQFHRDDGAAFWRQRQAGRLSRFPPLTVSLANDGKVHLSTIERTEAGR